MCTEGMPSVIELALGIVPLEFAEWLRGGVFAVQGLQDMLQFTSRPVANAAKQILRYAAAALDEPGQLLGRLPVTLHSEARLQFLRGRERLSGARVVTLLLGEGNTTSQCHTKLKTQLQNLQACTRLELTCLTDLKGEWSDSMAKHWTVQMAELRSVVHADLEFGGLTPIESAAQVLTAIGTDMLQTLTFRLPLDTLRDRLETSLKTLLIDAHFLQSVTLSWHPSDRSRFVKLPGLLAKLRHLQKLELAHLHLPTVTRDLLPRGLTRLALDGCHFPPMQGGWNMMAALARCSHIEELCLDDISFEECGWLGGATFPHLPALRRLELATKYEILSPAIVTRAVCACPPALRYLSLRNIELGPSRSLPLLCNCDGGLRDKAAGLQHLTLHNCRLGQSEIEEWCGVLNAMSALTTLHVREDDDEYGELSPKQKCAIAAAVAGLERLEKFYL